MSSRWSTRLLLATLVGALLWPAAALADPPGRVARLSFIGGSVSLRPASVDDWSLATLNYPLTIGDQVWTDRSARTELQLGSTVIRLGPFTAASVLNLDDHTVQLRVTQGAVSMRVRALGDSDVIEIDTPNGAASILRPGLYRIDVNDAGDDSTVTVREGEADIAVGTSAFPLRRDQSAELVGIDATHSDIRDAVPGDDFDAWCLARERRVDAVQATRYVSPEMVGYEDLDANGTWFADPSYGPVWIPRVGAEWAPYHVGHWVWAEPWGWTWIDDAPWGFAPFHYGRWAFLPARGWAWVPGTLAARPVYAPALVAFVGGSNWNVSVAAGSGPVGWFPLGPREVFVPAYHVTPDYVQRVNAAHVTNVNVTTITVTNITYVNRAVPGAMTVVSRDTFVRAQPVATAAVAISRDQARTASVVATAEVAPQRASIAGPAQTTATPPAAAVARRVVVRSTPPPAPAPFTAKQNALAQHPGRPLDESTENAIRTQIAPVPAEHPLVRVVAPPRHAPASPSPAVAPVRTPTPTPAAPVAATPSNPSVTPTPAAGTSSAGRSTSPQTAQTLAARQTKERADLDTRQTRDRATLQAKQDHELKQVTDPSELAALKKRQAQETKTLLDHQKQERDALLKRQQDEQKIKGSD
jgi:hypothetical protein